MNYKLCEAKTGCQPRYINIRIRILYFPRQELTPGHAIRHFEKAFFIPDLSVQKHFNIDYMLPLRCTPILLMVVITDGYWQNMVISWFLRCTAVACQQCRIFFTLRSGIEQALKWHIKWPYTTFGSCDSKGGKCYWALCMCRILPLPLYLFR